MAQRLFEMAPVRVLESTWQAEVKCALEENGWHTMSVMPQRTRYGWRSGVTTIGWPDILAVRDGWLLAIECKGNRTPIGPGQLEWLRCFAALPQGRAWILRPRDNWGQICEWIRDPAKSPRTYDVRTVPRAGASCMIPDHKFGSSTVKEPVS